MLNNFQSINKKILNKYKLLIINTYSFGGFLISCFGILVFWDVDSFEFYGWFYDTVLKGGQSLNKLYINNLHSPIVALSPFSEVLPNLS